MKYNKGFTLIELMIVVAIIGIIAMFVLPSYQNAQRKARITEAVAQMTELQSLIEKTRLTQRSTYNCMKLTGEPDPANCQQTVISLPHDGNIRYNNELIYTVVYAPAATAADKYTITATINGNWIPSGGNCRTLDLNGQGNLIQKNTCPK